MFCYSVFHIFLQQRDAEIQLEEDVALLLAQQLRTRVTPSAVDSHSIYLGYVLINPLP